MRSLSEEYFWERQEPGVFTPAIGKIALLAYFHNDGFGIE